MYGGAKGSGGPGERATATTSTGATRLKLSREVEDTSLDHSVGFEPTEEPPNLAEVPAPPFRHGPQRMARLATPQDYLGPGSDMLRPGRMGRLGHQPVPRLVVSFRRFPIPSVYALSLRARSFAGLDEPGPRSHRAGAKAKKAEVRATVCHFAPLIRIAPMACLIARRRATCA